MCPEDRLLYEFSDVSLFASDESRSESQQDYFVKGDETRISKMKDYFVCALVFYVYVRHRPKNNGEREPISGETRGFPLCGPCEIFH